MDIFKKGSFLLVVICILFLFAYDEMVLFVQGLIFIGLISAISGAFYFVMTLREQRLKMRVERESLELQARVIQTKDGTWLVSSHNLEIVPLHNNPYLRINGHHRNLDENELLFLNTQQKIIKGDYKPVIEEEVKKDLFSLIDQHSHTLLTGGTGNGKSVLLKLIADYKKSQGFKVVVLDSRSHPSHWEGFTRFETEEKINRIIIRLHQILESNIKALREGRATEADFQNHKTLVITDEWGRIVQDNEIAKLFIEIMAKESRKYGVYLVFCTQTNQASELGLDGRYKTMNCFLQLQIEQTSTGDRVVKAKKGIENLGEYEVPFVSVSRELPTGYRPLELEIDNVPLITDQEQAIKDSYLETHSLRAVIRNVLGIEDSKINSQHTEKVKATLVKLGVYTV